ncbi:MAG: hypothetical protein ACLUIR_10290 [Faecalibacterium prausnitzii]
MKILQVQFKNRNGHTLRGIVTLPDTEGKVPFVVHLHGFAQLQRLQVHVHPSVPRSGSAGHRQRPFISTATARATASSRI